MGCLLVLKASKNRRSKGKNPPWCLISANPPKCGDAGGLHRLLPVRAPKGVGGEGGNRTRGLPHPQSAKNASPRGWQKLPNGGDASPTRGFEWAIVGNLADNRARGLAPCWKLGVGDVLR